MKIWYRRLPEHPGNFWPILEIRLRSKNANFSQSVFALVDSGASISILHAELARALGFDLQKLGQPIQAGQSVSGNYSSWSLPEAIDTNICGGTFPIKFTVIDNNTLIWPCILGEDSIFQLARIDFWKYKGYFEVELRKDLN